MKSFLASLSLLVCATLASGADFDWKTRFPEGLVDNAGKTVDIATLKNKTVAVYCSAHWCPPCRTFTPELVKFANANKDKLAVVFISSDEDAPRMFALTTDGIAVRPCGPLYPLSRQAAAQSSVSRA